MADNNELTDRFKHWDTVSSAYYERYMDAKKNSPEKVPAIITEFCKEYRLAVDLPWVIDEIKEWVRYWNYEALECLVAVRPGEKKSAHHNDIDNLIDLLRTRL